MTTTFNFYADPGHGWLKVPMSLLDELGIKDRISQFSYVRKDFAYLEEDLDAGIFIDAMKHRGIEPKIRMHHANKASRIRGYPMFA
jgi:hypothetical protein